MNEIALKLVLDKSSIILITAASLNLSVFLYLFTKRANINNLAKRYLALSALFVSIWIFSSWINHFSQSVMVVTYFSRLSYTAAIWALFSLIAFAFSYQDKKLPWVYYLSGLLFSLFVLFTPFIIEKGIPATLSTKEDAVFGKLYQGWSVIMLILSGFLIFQLVRTYKGTSGMKRERIKYIVAFLVLSISLVIFFNLILPNLGERSFIFIGQYATFIFAAGSAWVILQNSIYSFFYSIANFASLLNVGILLFFLSWGTQKFEQEVLKWDITKIFYLPIILLGLFIASIVALFIDRVIPKVRNYYYKIFGLSIVSLNELRDWLIDQTYLTEDLQEYIDEFFQSMTEILHLHNVGLYLAKTNDFWIAKKGTGLETIDKKKFFNQGEIRFYDEQESNVIGVVFPLSIKGENFADFVLSHKKGDAFYSKEEVKSLNALVKILSVAVNRYAYYREQSNFNTILKEKVDKATSDIKAKNIALEETLRKERDMLDILGHELRTPLTIAKNSTLVLNKMHNNNTLTHDSFDKYIHMSEENLVRESKLLETLLSTTKIDNNALELDMVEVDFIDVVNDSFDGLLAKAHRKGLEMNFTKPASCSILADRNRIQEVVDNIIDNAIKYTPHGFVNVNLEEIGNEARLDIKDSGIGIGAEELKNLGQKFYRTNTYLESSKNKDYNIVRPGGTGLGLYVTFNLVKRMGGRVLVTSQLDKGSTFSIFMPLFEKKANESLDPDVEGAPKMTVFERFLKMKEKKATKEQAKPQSTTPTKL